VIDPGEVDTGEFPLPRLDLELPRAISSSVRVDVAALSDKGKVRERNEDHYFVARGGRHATTLLTNVPAEDVPSEFGETVYLMIVADGMGGHAGGEVASRMAIATLINIILHVPDWILRLDDEYAQKVMDRSVARFRQIHEALQKRARLDPGLRGMGTTMTAAYSLGDDLFIAQVGDSRAYRFRDGTLQLLTRDQTHAQMLADQGLISHQDVARHRLRHVLTSALGGSQGDVRAEIHRSKLADGDRLLLCSDGLTDMIDEACITEVLGRSTDSDEACRLLVESALAKGGRDNVTVVLARYSIPGD
jgi:protein phosphatase